MRARIREVAHRTHRLASSLHAPKSMRPACGVIALLLCAPAAPGWQQTWKDAFQAGDYRRAADLLHPLIADFERQFDDPEPFRHAAILYAGGLGVPRDPIVACALAQMADIGMQSRPPAADTLEAYQAAEKERLRFVQDHCGRLSAEQRRAASLSMGCFAFGMPEQEMSLGARTVHVGRLGIRLEGDDTTPDGLPDCPWIVARVSVRAIEPPADAAPGVRARHLLEMFSWHGGRSPDGAIRYGLRWIVQEVVGTKLELVAMADLAEAAVWPNPPLPSGFDGRLTVEMIRSGHVRWRLDGQPPKRGWIMLPEERGR
jgi:hypothetical protein